uniref:Uncharacterized protein n=1 Tax=Leersia perrieri TaxID=77586 RepID=A0A0D9X3J0_9ORYZ
MASSSVVRQRPTTIGSSKQSGEDGVTGDRPPPAAATARPSVLSQALASTASLANLLPTGTVMAFQLLSPTFTNNGSCDAITWLLAAGLLAVLALSCAAACFTDSVKLSDGRVYYGLATPRGLWLLDYPPAGAGDGAATAPLPDMSRYRVRAIDVVHAAMSVAVFAAVAARDKNVVGCFWPAPEKETAEVLGIVPLGVGVICSLLFVVFPTTRHGIGYPVVTN